MKKGQSQTEENLFSASAEVMKTAPLAERMRPRGLAEFIGQAHLVGKGKLLHRLVTSGKLTSCIFYGPPGTGKTTLSSIIANVGGANFVKLNAVSSGVAEAKAVLEKARVDREMFGKKTYLLLDECHRWNKAQSDSVLGAIERGDIVFIGSTTENPFYSMTPAIVSRCRIFEFKPLSEENIKSALKAAVADKERGLGNYKIKISDEAYEAFTFASGGDVRKALGNLELAFLTTDANELGEVEITPEIASECSGGRNLAIDSTTYYDMLSAFCKSLRGTDPDGAVYWAYRLIESGVDPLVVARRLVVHSSEDVGLASSQALTVAVSALTAYKELGYPEGIIPLTHAIIAVATSPKSNAVVVARDRANEAVKNTAKDPVPGHLKNYNFLNEKREGYKYPHSFGGYVEQQYLPDSLVGEKFYEPTENGNERKIKEVLENLKEKK